MAYLETLPFTAVFGAYYLTVIALFYNLFRQFYAEYHHNPPAFVLPFIGAGAPAVTCALFLFHGGRSSRITPTFWSLTIPPRDFDRCRAGGDCLRCFFRAELTDRAIKAACFAG